MRALSDLKREERKGDPAFDNYRIVLTLAIAQIPVLLITSCIVVKRMNNKGRTLENFFFFSVVVWLMGGFAILVAVTTHLKVFMIKATKIEKLANYLNTGCTD